MRVSEIQSHLLVLKVPTAVSVMESVRDSIAPIGIESAQFAREGTPSMLIQSHLLVLKVDDLQGAVAPITRFNRTYWY